MRCGLAGLRKAYRRAGTIWLLADRASGHTARATLALAQELGIAFVWLPKQWPELNAMDQLWRGLKQEVAANRQAASITELAERAARWVLDHPRKTVAAAASALAMSCGRDRRPSGMPARNLAR